MSIKIWISWNLNVNQINPLEPGSLRRQTCPLVLPSVLRWNNTTVEYNQVADLKIIKADPPISKTSPSNSTKTMISIDTNPSVRRKTFLMNLMMNNWKTWMLILLLEGMVVYLISSKEHKHFRAINNSNTNFRESLTRVSKVIRSLSHLMILIAL